MSVGTFLPVFDVRLDPVAVAKNRTELKINDGPIRIDQKGIDWGDATIQAYMAEQLVGSSTVDYRLPNREVSIPLFLGADESESFDLAKTQLMNKVARFQVEGGWIQRMPGFYGDVVNATLTFPDVWGEAGGVEPDVLLKLECLPDFYGDEIQLDVIGQSEQAFVPDGSGMGTGSGLMSQVWASAIYSTLKLGGSQAIIKGDYPGRIRLGVTNTESSYDMHSLLWGLRSRYYVSPFSDASAQLAYNCHQLTAVGGASQQAAAASPTQFPLAVGGTWITGLTTTIPELGLDMSHIGTYRVWLVVRSDNQPQIRLGWVTGSQSVLAYNDAVTIPGPPGVNYLVDLGEIRIDPSPIGKQTWMGLIQGYSALAAGGDNLYLQDLFLQPLDDGGGRLIYNGSGASPPAAAIATPKPAGAGADGAAVGNTAWVNPGNIRGQDNNPSQIAFSDNTKTSHYLQATSFGFAIPAGAVIRGIVAQFICRTDQVGGVFDNGVIMATNGAKPPDPPIGVANPGSPSTSSWPTGYSTRTYGDPTNLWGAAWTPALINAAGFGLQIACKPGGVGYVTYPVNGFVDFVQITVYYSIGSGPGLTGDAVVFYNGYTELRTDGMYRSTGAYGGSNYAEVSRVIGDLPRIPPSGMESRPCEVFIKPSTGDLAFERDAVVGTINYNPSFTVQPYYRPSYLFPP